MLALFARSNTGQFYIELCIATGKTMRELGELKDHDPEGYEFLETALSERIKRYNDARKRSSKKKRR